MTKDHLKRRIDAILERYLDFGDSAAIIVRELKKTANAEVRGKLTAELRNIDKKRIGLLDQIDDPTD